MSFGELPVQDMSLRGIVRSGNRPLEKYPSGYYPDTFCCEVSQGSIVGALLFLIYINDLHCAIGYCSVYHFADDTNLLNCNNSVKAIHK